MMGIIKLIVMVICLCLVFFIGFINGFIFGVSIEIPDNITVSMDKESIRVIDEANAIKRAENLEYNINNDNYRVLVE